MKKLPDYLPNVYDWIYSNFWQRLWAFLLDTLIVLPVSLLELFLNGLGKNYVIYTGLFQLCFTIFYNGYIVQRYGATPGKMQLGLRIISLNGNNVNWKQAFIRILPLLIISVLTLIIYACVVGNVSEEDYLDAPFMQRQNLPLQSLGISIYLGLLTFLWFISDTITFLADKKNRALHDHFAGTVVIKVEYHEQIYNYLNPPVMVDLPANHSD